MSFQETKRKSIKRYMLEKIRQGDGEFIQKTMDNCGISVTTVKRYLKECLEQEILQKNQESKTGYRLHTMYESFSFLREGMPSEEVIYSEKMEPLLKDVSPEGKRIWYYGFTEMMNNAMEHAGCSTVRCTLRWDYLYTEISIADDGIGIFRNVAEHLRKSRNEAVSYRDAMAELYKGKYTTKPENHSGEGIFFTSKVFNEFAIWSDNTIYSCGCSEKDKFIQSHLVSYYNKFNQIGTMVVMKLENHTTRTIKEVFDMFAPIEEGFVKTRIPLAEICYDRTPMARSQARRILDGLERFKEVEFDFDGVDFMGQGFADEVFRVFQNAHPDMKLKAINGCPFILGMIKHVQGY